MGFKFGFGLSYTEFAYSNPQLEGETVRIRVTNTGSLPGAEVAQLYVAPPQDGIPRPIRELKGFAKVHLQPGESREVTFNLDERCFAIWDNGWKVPGGKYTILIGGDPDKLKTVDPLKNQVPKSKSLIGSLVPGMKNQKAPRHWSSGRKLLVESMCLILLKKANSL